jgi:hypothetical protein
MKGKRTLVNMVMKFRVLKTAEIFLLPEQLIVSQEIL